MSLVEADLALAQDAQAILSNLMGEPVVSVEPLGGGRNSQVYRFTCRSGHRYVAKRYCGQRTDGEDRLRVEFSSLQFLWRNGLRCVPQPIREDERQRYAVYGYVEGEGVRAGLVREREIDEAIHFVERLKALAHNPESCSLPMASEACFSAEDLVRAVVTRLRRLETVPQTGQIANKLHRFLADSFGPTLEQVRRRSQEAYHAVGLAFDRALPLMYRTLSPSDFGFHNALRRPNGEVVFIDFEYFGWDDPAKMICDFLLHPGMDLEERTRHDFVRKVLPIFETHGDLRCRLEVVFPLCGLNWCLILFNEFVPGFYARRHFAQGGTLEGQELLQRQLERSEKRLERIQQEDGHFPFRD